MKKSELNRFLPFGADYTRLATWRLWESVGVSIETEEVIP